MGLHDLPFVVDLHLENFPSGFFARLGKRFLARYYRTFLDGPLAVAVVSEDEEGTAGYLVGVLAPGQHRRLLLRHHGAALATTGLTALMVRPRLALEFLRTRLGRYLRGVREAGTADPESPPTTSGELAVLSFVAVAARSRSRGHGTALVDEFLRLAAEAGCVRACLVTEPSNSLAQSFYEKRDWETVGHTERRPLDGHLRYRRRLPVAESTQETGAGTGADPVGPGASNPSPRPGASRTT